MRRLLHTAAAVAFAFGSAGTAAGQAGQPRWDWATVATSVTDNHVVNRVAHDAAGNTYVLGRSEGYGAPQSDTTRFGASTLVGITGFIGKLNAAGQWLWAVPLPNSPDAGDLAVDPASGDVAITGYFTDTLRLGATTIVNTRQPAQATFVARLSGNGQWRWATAGSARQGCAGDAVTFGSNGQVIVAGTFQCDSLLLGTHVVRNPHYRPGGWSTTGFVASVSGTGQWQWATQAGGKREYAEMFGRPAATGHRLVLSAQGTILLSGNCDSAATFGPYVQPTGPYVARLSPTGQWLGAVGPPMPMTYSISDLTVDPAGNAYVTGSRADSVTMYTARLSAAGQWQWVTYPPDPYTRASNGLMRQVGASLAADAWGNVFVVGSFEYNVFCGSSPGGGPVLPNAIANVYLLDAATGAQRWNLQSASASSHNAYATTTSLVTDNLGSVYLGGYYYDSYASFGQTTLPALTDYSGLFVAKLTDPVIRARALGVADASTPRLNLWPNPAHGTAQLTLATAPTSSLTVQVLDNLGRTVRTQPAMTQETTLDLRGLPAGLYTVRAGNSHQPLVVE